MKSTFPYFTLEGSPYEIGYQHGKKCKKQILNSINTYKNMFKDYSNVLWDDAKKRSLEYIDYIKDYDEDLLEEIKGISEGAELEIEDIMCLNTRSEVIMMENTTDGCSSIAVEPYKSSTGKAILSQNWDWKTSQLNSMVILNIKQKNKPDILMVTEAGIIGKIGFNSKGLGVCLNALGTNGFPEGVPLHIILRGILNSTSISKAIHAVVKNKNACAANYMISHKDSGGIDIETTIDDFDVVYPDNGTIVHTNHFISKRFINIKDTTRIMIPDTFIRYKRLNDILNKKKDRISVEDLMSILTDHDNYPDGICRHENKEDPEELRMSTLFSIIMDLKNMNINVTKGNPCENEYTKYNL